jgi:DNA invertase Pin-like site-specific DNA recombinase
MSTEHQQYSIANQAAAIALYAAAHNIGIVRSFIDEGKTGTTIKRRPGLQQLLTTVQSGAVDFDLILVYDVSRWGRFPDVDEAAHYEFLCKKAGLQVRYCAEQFENDNSTTSNLLKALKRTMAGEYSRELSVKVSAGQQRLAAMGFWQGGVAPFGMLRQLVSQNGEVKEILKSGQWKNITTDRVILMPGPQEAVDTIRLAYDLYTKEGKTRREIAEILNQRGYYWGKGRWTMEKLRYLLTNPIYKGAYPYRKSHNSKDLAKEEWLVLEHAFPAIISDIQWACARERVRQETKPLVNAEMLEQLRSLWKQKGKLNSKIINAARSVPSAGTYHRHFGGMNETYKLIGFSGPRDYSFLKAISITRKMRATLRDQICAEIRAAGGTAEPGPGAGLMVINGNISAKLTFSSGRVDRTGQTLWTLPLNQRITVDILIVARLKSGDRTVLDYYVIPAISGLHGALSVRTENNPIFLDLYHFPTLQLFVEPLRSYSILEELC